MKKLTTRKFMVFSNETTIIMFFKKMHKYCLYVKTLALNNKLQELHQGVNYSSEEILDSEVFH